MGSTSIKYRTFDSLLTDLELDLRVLEEEGLVEPAQLIKVARRVNYDLGLRINQTKEIILEVNNNVAKLPEDFFVLNFALLTSHHKCITPVTWAGRHTEQIGNLNGTPVCTVSGCTDQPCLIPLTYDTNRLNPQGNYGPANTCTPEWDPWFQRSCFSTCGGDGNVRVIENRGYEVREYSHFEKLHIKPQTFLDPLSMNSRMTECGTAEIKNGYLYVHSKESCKVYISYQGELEDEQGNLLVLDHPEINFYYLAALQEQVFKSLWYSSGEEVKVKYDAAKMETREARARALSIVNMPNFQDMKAVFEGNRRAQYSRYYDFWRTSVYHSWFTALPFSYGA